MESLGRHTVDDANGAISGPGTVSCFVQFVNQTVGKHFKCCICLSLFVDPVMLPCNHALCRACATQALKENQRCPQCMVTIPNLRTLQGRNAWITEMVNSLRNCLNEVGASLTQHAPVPPMYQNARPPKPRARARQRRSSGSASSGRIAPPSPPSFVSCGGGGGGGGSTGRVKRKNKTTEAGGRTNRKRPPPSRSSATTMPPTAAGASRPQPSRGRSRGRVAGGGVASARWERRTPSPRKQARGGESIWGFQAKEPEDEETFGRPEMLAVTPAGSSAVNCAVDDGPSSRTSNVAPPRPFVIGDLVFVDHRTWPGVNKHGGVALITAVLDPPGSRYDVKYSVSQGLDRGVEAFYVHPYSFPSESVGMRSRRGGNGGWDGRGRRSIARGGGSGAASASASAAAAAAAPLQTSTSFALQSVRNSTAGGPEREAFEENLGEKDDPKVQDEREAPPTTISQAYGARRRDAHRERVGQGHENVEDGLASDSADGGGGSKEDSKGTGSDDARVTDDEAGFDEVGGDFEESDDDSEATAGQDEDDQLLREQQKVRSEEEQKDDEDEDEADGKQEEVKKRAEQEQGQATKRRNAAQPAANGGAKEVILAPATIAQVAGRLCAQEPRRELGNRGAEYGQNNLQTVGTSLTAATGMEEARRSPYEPPVSSPSNDVNALVPSRSDPVTATVIAGRMADCTTAEKEGAPDHHALLLAANGSPPNSARSSVPDSASPTIVSSPPLSGNSECLELGVESKTAAVEAGSTSSNSSANGTDGNAEAGSVPARDGHCRSKSPHETREDVRQVFNLSAYSEISSESSPPAVRDPKDLARCIHPPLLQTPSSSSSSSSSSSLSIYQLARTTPLARMQEPLSGTNTPGSMSFGYKVGDLVDVRSQTSPGLNKEGGVARITRVDPTNEVYDVKYLVRKGTDKGVVAALLSRYDVGGGDEGQPNDTAARADTAGASTSDRHRSDGATALGGPVTAGGGSCLKLRVQRTTKWTCPPDAAAELANAKCLNKLLGGTQHPELLLDFDLGDELDLTAEGSPVEREKKRKAAAAVAVSSTVNSSEGGNVVDFAQGVPGTRRARDSSSGAGRKPVRGTKGVMGEDPLSGAGKGAGAGVSRENPRKMRRIGNGKVCADKRVNSKEDGDDHQFGDESLGESEAVDSANTVACSGARQSFNGASSASSVDGWNEQKGKSIVTEQRQWSAGCIDARSREGKRRTPTSAFESAGGDPVPVDVARQKRPRSRSASPRARAPAIHDSSSQGEWSSGRGGIAKSGGSVSGSRGAVGQGSRRGRGGRVVLTMSGLTSEMAALAHELAKSRGWAIESKYNEDITHVVCGAEVETNKVNIRSAKFLRAVAAGKWIVNESWLQECKLRGTQAAEEDFEISGDKKSEVPSAPRRSRLAHSNPDRPGLFHDTIFHFRGAFGTESPPRSELEPMLRANGGVVAEMISALFSGNGSSDECTVGGETVKRRRNVEGNDQDGSAASRQQRPRRVVLFQASGSSPQRDAESLATQLAALELERARQRDVGVGEVEIMRPLWLVDSIGSFRVLKPTDLHRVVLPQVLRAPTGL